MNKFIKNHGWHLLMFFITLTLFPICVKFKIMDLHNTGSFFRILLGTFISFSSGFLIEWYQGVFHGANKGKTGEKFFNKDWVKDVITSGVSGTVGVILGEIFFI
jgi:hypothetical protein